MALRIPIVRPAILASIALFAFIWLNASARPSDEPIQIASLCEAIDRPELRDRLIQLRATPRFDSHLDVIAETCHGEKVVVAFTYDKETRHKGLRRFIKLFEKRMKPAKGIVEIVPTPKYRVTADFVGNLRGGKQFPLDITLEFHVSSADQISAVRTDRSP